MNKINWINILPEEAIKRRKPSKSIEVEKLSAFFEVGAVWIKEIQIGQGGIYSLNNGYAFSLGKFLKYSTYVVF